MWFGVVAVSGATTGWAQAPTAATNVGPGRIICRNATSCELDIGTPASLSMELILQPWRPLRRTG